MWQEPHEEIESTWQTRTLRVGDGRVTFLDVFKWTFLVHFMTRLWRVQPVHLMLIYTHLYEPFPCKMQQPRLLLNTNPHPAYFTKQLLEEQINEFEILTYPPWLPDMNHKQDFCDLQGPQTARVLKCVYIRHDQEISKIQKYYFF